MQQNLDRFEFRWYDLSIKFMAKVINLNIEDDYAIVSYSFANEYTPDEEVKITDGLLMQSTGLRDKNGKLIFEGDVVQEKYENHLGNIEYDNHLVIFKNSCFQFAIQGDLDNLEIMCSMKEQEDKNLDVEIIGNIYETPQFLKKL
jgi:uncharacterized phage protein (TIGR01671 family)